MTEAVELIFKIVFFWVVPSVLTAMRLISTDDDFNFKKEWGAVLTCSVLYPIGMMILIYEGRKQ